MLFILGSLLFFISLLTGFGRLCGRPFGIMPANPWAWTWVGFFSVSMLAMLVSTVAPLGIEFLVLFVAGGGIGFVLWCRDYCIHMQNALPGNTFVFWLIMVSAAFSLACFFAFPEWIFYSSDTDLYHANTVRWMNEYGTPPGLANIHVRLGFNSAWLVFSALLDNGIWDGRTAWIMPSLGLLAVTFYFLHGFLFDTNKIVRLYSLCVLPWPWLKITKTIPSLYYDDPSLFLCTILLTECVRFSSENDINTRAQAKLLLLLAASAFTIKPIAAVSVCFTVLLAVDGLRRSSLCSLKNFVWVFWPAVAAAAIWIGKNVLLSGYPFFPLPMGALPLQWTLPHDLALSNYEDIIAWARMPGPEYRQAVTGWDWLVPWLVRHAASKCFWLMAAIPFFLALPFWARAFFTRNQKHLFFFCLWSIANIVYWFLTAPALRFGERFFISFLALGRSAPQNLDRYDSYSPTQGVRPCPSERTMPRHLRPEWLWPPFPAKKPLLNSVPSSVSTRRSSTNG